MTGTAAALGLLVRTCWRVARRDLLRALLETVGSLCRASLPWWIALVVAGMGRHSAPRVEIALAGLLMCTVLDWLLSMLGAQGHVAMAEKVSFAFERQIAEVTGSIPTLDHFDDPNYADEIQILDQNQGRIGGGVSGLVHALDVLVNAAFVVVVSAVVDPRLLLLALTVLPSLLGARLRIAWNQRGEDASAQSGRLTRHLLAVSTDPQYGMELRVYGLRRRMISLLEESISTWQRPRLSSARRGAALSVVEDLVTVVVVTGSVTLWLLWALADGRSNPAAVVVAVVAARQIQQALVQVVGEFGGIAETLQFVRRYQSILVYAGRQQPRDRTERLTDGSSGISLAGVDFTYAGSTQPALRDISVHLEPGTVIAFVGENGAGKTTLVQLLLGLYRPTSGTLTADGFDLSTTDLTTWRTLTTATFQDYARPELTVLHTVGLGDIPRMDDSGAVERALADVDGGRLLAVLPDGLDTQLGATWPSGVDLSGGQWQKTALARGAMRTAARLTVLDEPTAALDAHAEHELFAHYSELVRTQRYDGGITVLVTHRFSTVGDADRILVLNGGRVVEDGTHDELMASGAQYADLYTAQARGYT